MYCTLQVSSLKNKLKSVVNLVIHKFIDLRKAIDCEIVFSTIVSPFLENQHQEKQMKKIFGSKLKNAFVNQLKHLFEFEINETSAVAVKFDNYYWLVPYCKQYCQGLTEPQVYCKYETHQYRSLRIRIEIKIQTAKELSIVSGTSTKSIIKGNRRVPGCYCFNCHLFCFVHVF